MDSRAVAIRVEGLVTLQSPVKTGKAVVHLSMAPLSVPTDFAIRFGDGSEHCYPPADDNGNRAIAFSSLSPGEANTFVFWIVVLDAIAPNHPNGNPDVLNVALNPQIELATATTAKLSGSRVLFCNGESGSPVVALGPEPYSCSDGSTGPSPTPLPVTTGPRAQSESPATTPPTAPTTPPTATAVAYPIIGGPTAVRIKPDLSAASITTLENGTPVRITCTATGSSVTGPGNITSNVWDRLELSGGYVPDVYVRTGTTDRVAPPC